MDIRKVNLYAACDKAIREVNRLLLEAFGRLKTMKFNRNLLKTVLELYRKLLRLLKKRYYEIGFEAYLIALSLCGIDGKRAHQMAEEAITEEWVEMILTQVDPVTEYRFDTETERKAYRLAEVLEVSNDRDYEVNKALRFFSQQMGQYAINTTDYAVIRAYEDAGIDEVEWVSAKDERVCNECHAYDGQIFPIDRIPAKHWGCRCMVRPVLKG